MVCRYCVLLITGEDQTFLPGNKAFLDFASANKKDVLRFAYVYQHQQQPLCQALLPNQASLTPQVSHRQHTVHSHLQYSKFNLIFISSFSIYVKDNVHLLQLLASTFLQRENRNVDSDQTSTKCSKFDLFHITNMLQSLKLQYKFAITDRWWFSRGGARLARSCTALWVVAGTAAKKTSTASTNSWSSFRKTPPIWAQTLSCQN